MKREICVAKCPELDYEGRHCVEEQDGYCHTFYKEHGCCPVGNIPEWVAFDHGGGNK